MEITSAVLTNLYYKISMLVTLRHRYESTFFGAETFGEKCKRILISLCRPRLATRGGGGTVSWRTVNKKLTKLYWPSRKHSPQRLIVLWEPKKWRGNDQNKYPAQSVSPLWAGLHGAPRIFKFVPAPQDGDKNRVKIPKTSASGKLSR